MGDASPLASVHKNMNVRNGWLAAVCVLVALVPVRGKLCAQTAEGASITKDGTNNASPSVKQETPDNGGFFDRLFRAYADDWFGRTPESPEAPRRGYSAPLTSPPFPFSAARSSTDPHWCPERRWWASHRTANLERTSKELGEQPHQVVWMDKRWLQLQHVGQALWQCARGLLCSAELHPIRPSRVLHRPPS